jgi:predicted nucleotidyltransferase
MKLDIQNYSAQIKKFCIKWKVTELALFGSVIRNDFDPIKSDVDVLITFEENHSWGWEIVTMKEELEEIFKRPVDLVSKRAIENSKNPYRKNEILNSYEIIYDQTAQQNI